MSTSTATRLAASSAGTSSPHESEYRLTRRGRLVVLLAGVFMLLAIGVAFAGVSLASEEPEMTEIFVVGPGDTLWDIAADLGDGRDVRAMMRHIEQLNSLDSVSLAVGQRLAVPVE